MPVENSISCHPLETDTNIQLFHLKTRKFKTVTVKVFIKGSLGDHVEEQAIVPFILKRGSMDHPSMARISQALERLYGARMALDIGKMGEKQVFISAIDIVNDCFLPGKNGLIRNAVALLKDVLFRPLVDEGGFVKPLFSLEKKNLQKFIASRIDDKITYANLRLIQEMFQGRPFGSYEWGDPKRVANLDRVAAFDFYQRLIEAYPMAVYIMGEIEPDAAGEIFHLLTGDLKRGEIGEAPEAKPCEPDDGAVVVEEQHLEQSKLVMGFHIRNDCDDALYYAFFLYNSILGGGSFSKLFKSVREKEGLAYYVHSIYDKLKGFLRVGAGIHRDKFEMARSLVLAQMDQMAAGDISDDELSNARKALISGLTAVKDNPGQLIDYHHLATLAGRQTDVDAVIERIGSVTRDQVVAAASLVKPGKTFFLKGIA